MKTSRVHPSLCSLYWENPPPEPSARLTEWSALIDAGWKPNRRISAMGYSRAADWYGVYYWEYLNVIAPRVRE